MVDLLELADRANVVAELVIEVGRLDSGELPDIEVFGDRLAPSLYRCYT